MEKENCGRLIDYKDSTDFPAEWYLQVNNCGIKRIQAPDYTVLRSKGRKDYYLLYVMRGLLGIEILGEMTEVREGQCAIHMPGIRQKLLFTAEGNPTVYYFVHFTGTAVAETMSSCLASIDDVMVCTVESRTLFETLFYQMMQTLLPLKALVGYKPIFTPKVNGLLLQLIDLFAQSYKEKSQPAQMSMTSAMAYISEHLHENIALTECAAISHLSPSRFSHLFTEQMGVSPHKFIISLRMDEARELLLYSSMSIREISESLGFTDATYFSRIFRKYTGSTPFDFRQRR